MSKFQFAQSRSLIGDLSHLKPCILVCAPSNAAVDELTERLLVEGIVDMLGRRSQPNLIVRVAHMDKVRQSIRNVTLSALVKQHTARIGHQAAAVSVLNQLTDQRNLTAESQITSNEGKLLNMRIEVAQAMASGSPDKKEKVQDILLKHADIVLSTLSSSDSDALVNHRFDWLIVDEAAQCSEPSVLVALNKLKTGGRCLMIGGQAYSIEIQQ